MCPDFLRGHFNADHEWRRMKGTGCLAAQRRFSHFLCPQDTYCTWILTAQERIFSPFLRVNLIGISQPWLILFPQSVNFLATGLYFNFGPNTFFKKVFFALAGVVQWIEHRPVSQRVAGSIPSQGTYLGCRPSHAPSRE